MNTTDSDEPSGNPAASQRTFEAIFEHANDAIFIVDVERDRIVDCNPAAEELVEFSREELLSMDASELHPHNFSQFASFAESVIADGEGWTDEITCYRKDGEIVPAEMSASVVEIDGRPHLVNHIRETTDRAERDWFQSLIEHGTDIMLIVEVDGTVRYESASLTTVLGHETVHGESVFDYVHPDDVSMLRETVEMFEVIGGSSESAHEFRFRRADGSWAWLEATLSNRPDSPITGYVLNARDVTARKESRQQAVVLNRMLRHNLRNGLNVVIGHAQQFADAETPEVAASGEAVVSKAWELYEQASYAKELADILESAHYTRRPHNLSVLVDETVDELADSFPDVEFSVDLPERVCVMAAPKLGLAVEHVVRNAAEHNDAATPQVEITTQIPATDAGVVELTVADNGPGIPTDEKEVLLDGDETPLKHGSGLGLWIVNWIITRTGGRIAFERNEPRGSRVTLALPPAE